jgi:UDP-N-acetylenolpyruvoylglucosamine reductase
LLPGAVLCAVVDNIRARTGGISEVTAKVQQCWMVDKGVQHG